MIAGIYSYFLIYKAHKAIKENLFAHPADGRPTPETWSRKDGVILALAFALLTRCSILAGPRPKTLVNNG